MPFQALSRLSFLTVFALTGLAWPKVSVSSPGILSESEDYVFQDLPPPDSVIMLTLQETVMQALEHNLVRSAERPKIFDSLILFSKKHNLIPRSSSADDMTETPPLSIDPSSDLEERL